MSYLEAVAELNALAPELFTAPGRPRRKFSLDEVRILLQALRNPHLRFPSVLIAGTNGKGSTAATLASILTAAGLRTGLYTSPHLERPNERIRVTGPGTRNRDIADDDFAFFYFQVRDTAARLVAEGRLAQGPSFFEILTAMAFLHFAAARVQIAVLEVGLGGRLDATNVVDPRVSVITDISLDHMEWLGNSIREITHEKAGILRPRGVLVTLPQHPDANQVLGEVATELKVRGVPATPYMPSIDTAPGEPYVVQALGGTLRVASPLAGVHQQRNVALAIAAAVELARHHGLPVSPASIAAGIRSTRWPGRLERMQPRLQSGPADSGPTEWILDVAHNPAGAWALRAALRPLFDATPDRPHTLVFSCLRDKPLAELAQILFPLFDRVVFAPIASPRAASIADLLAAAAATGTPAVAASSVAEALLLAQSAATPPAATSAHVVAPVSRSPRPPSPDPNPTPGSPGEEAQGLGAGPGTPGALIVVSGSVYLVGEARHILLASTAP